MKSTVLIMIVAANLAFATTPTNKGKPERGQIAEQQLQRREDSAVTGNQRKRKDRMRVTVPPAASEQLQLVAPCSHCTPGALQQLIQQLQSLLFWGVRRGNPRASEGRGLGTIIASRRPR